MRVTSSPSSGSTFMILLPLSDREPVEVENGEATSLCTGTGDILLVDEQPLVLEIGQRMLARLSFQVTSAQGGKEGISLLKSSTDTFDLVILVLIMPTVNGEEVFNSNHTGRPELTVLLSSGYTIDCESGTLMERGCKGFIQKPFTIKKLSKEVERVLHS